MALIITADCINCGACEPECPNTAIYNAGADWTFSDGTKIIGQIEYHGEMVEVNRKFSALSDRVYFIVPEKCTECVGFYDEPQCASVCPVDCCVDDPERRESKAELIAKKKKLHP